MTHLPLYILNNIPPFIEEMKQKEVEKTEKVKRQTAGQAKKRLQIDPADSFEEELQFSGGRFDSEDNDDAFCLFCVEAFSRSKAGEKWIRCCKCNEWAHVICAGVDPKIKMYICGACR
ncbi:hypothetical protein RI129_011882 [Pyrocoelia pectoralis]|uniref:Zinc finger PHD-type domain-containing protein n=1 Tax=Pyrocoelia pectoralis TaxID=417401 RepID=A0AAN7UXP1_9COLE